MSSTASQIDALASSSDLPARLAAALALPRPRSTSRARMAPELSYGRHAGPAPLGARAAAVILVVFRRHGRWFVPLTKRPAALIHHGGQMSLPGGTIEPGESSEQAAAREFREELGLDVPLEMLGQLADCYVFASNFVVTPWLAAIPGEPHWQPDAREVEQVVELPIDLLVNSPLPPVEDSPWRGEDGVSESPLPSGEGRVRGRSPFLDSTTIHRGPLEFRAPCYRIDDACIWGATSVILNELADLLATAGTFHAAEIAPRGG